MLKQLDTLIGFAKSEKWPKQQIRFLEGFLDENGVEDGDESAVE